MNDSMFLMILNFMTSSLHEAHINFNIAYFISRYVPVKPGNSFVLYKKKVNSQNAKHSIRSCTRGNTMLPFRKSKFILTRFMASDNESLQSATVHCVCHW